VAAVSARLREALELVLLFHRGGPWGDAKTDRWREITGRYRPNFGSNTDSDEVTTRLMCDHIRKVLAEPHVEVSDFEAGSPTARAVARLRQEVKELRAAQAAWLASPEAAQRLDGYRELAHRCATLERERDEARQMNLQRLRALASNPRCSRCGDFASDHDVDDEERRHCQLCECQRFEAPS
jgi:hypothetical protein